MCNFEVFVWLVYKNHKGSSLLKTEDSERAIMTLQSTYTGELATDEASVH